MSKIHKRHIRFLPKFLLPVIFLTDSNLKNTVSNAVGETSNADENIEVPVTYIIDKETNTVTSINIVIDEDMEMGIKMNLSLNIASTDNVDLSLPDSVKNNVLAQ